MRNLKKVLALVLALVMSLSLVTIANAADFSDSADINYDEAIDVMVAAGIIDGVGGNNFDPKGTLTREQAAKLITYMLMGENSNDLGIESSSFKDVAVTRWSAPAIEYCATLGIIDGAGDGNFYPAGKLTGYAFAKMLLTALGYDSKIEKFVGNGWTINVATVGMNVGLHEDMDKMFGPAEITREEAAQMAFNAMQTPLVEYEDKGTTLSVNGAVVEFGAKKAQYVTTELARQQTISDRQLTNSTELNRKFTVEFAEKYCQKLVLDPDTDAFGRPSHTWYYDGEKIGQYIRDPDLTYTIRTTSGDIYKDLGLSKAVRHDRSALDASGRPTTVDDVNIVVDGSRTKVDSSSNATWHKDDADWKYDDADIVKGGKVKFGGNGVLTQVFKDVDDVGNVTLTITVIHTYVGRVSSIIPATSNAERKVRLTYITPVNERAETYRDTGNSAVSDLVYETDNFAVGDLVSFTMASDNAVSATFSVQDVKKLEKTASGTLTAFTGSKVDDSKSSFTAGETYKYNPKVGFESGYSIVKDYDMTSELDVYCDEYGYALYVEASELAKNYAVVIGLGSSNIYGDKSNGATLLLADGSKVQVTYKMSKNSDLSNSKLFGNKVNFVGDLVSYTVGSDGVYTLTELDNGRYDIVAAGSGSHSGKNNDVEFLNNKSYIDIENKHLYTTKDTVFFVRTGAMNDCDKWTYNVYTGYASAPTMKSYDASGNPTNTAGVTYATNRTFGNQVDAVFIAIGNAVGGGENTLFVKPDSFDVFTENGTSEAYAVLPVVKDGEVTTMKVSYRDVLSRGGELDSVDWVLADSYTTDSDGIVTSISAKAYNGDQQIGNPKGMTGEYYGAIGTVETRGDVVRFGDSTAYNTMDWAYSKDTKVYKINEDMDTITSITVNDIYMDGNDVVHYILDSNTKTVKSIYIFEVGNDLVKAYTDTASGNVKGIFLDEACSDELVTAAPTDPNLAPGTAIYVAVTAGYKAKNSNGAGGTGVAEYGDLMEKQVKVGNTTCDVYKFVFNGNGGSTAHIQFAAVADAGNARPVELPSNATKADVQDAIGNANIPEVTITGDVTLDRGKTLQTNVVVDERAEVEMPGVTIASGKSLTVKGDLVLTGNVSGGEGIKLDGGKVTIKTGASAMPTIAGAGTVEVEAGVDANGILTNAPISEAAAGAVNTPTPVTSSELKFTGAGKANDFSSTKSFQDLADRTNSSSVSLYNLTIGNADLAIAAGKKVVSVLTYGNNQETYGIYAAGDTVHFYEVQAGDVEDTNKMTFTITLGNNVTRVTYYVFDAATDLSTDANIQTAIAGAANKFVFDIR